jgi:hypothetical protein
VDNYLNLENLFFFHRLGAVFACARTLCGKKAEVGQDFGPYLKPVLVQLASTTCAQPARLGVIHRPSFQDGGKNGTFTLKTALPHPAFFAILEALRGPPGVLGNKGFGGRRGAFLYRGLNKK